mmetsp:Transcript_33016/g.58102  ORF Transcript_33016/g.58102 Transcript_33016/m.58102 type:complete len:483 (-) Transcript_33016:32-1480(-)
MDSHISLKLKQLKDQMQQQKKARAKRPQSASKVIVAEGTDFLSTSALLGFDEPLPKQTPRVDQESAEVLNFLKEIGLERYWDSFREAQVTDIEVLYELTDEHLTSIGLPIGHRIKLLKRIRETRNDSKPISPPKLKPAIRDDRKVRFEESELQPTVQSVRSRQAEASSKQSKEDLMPSLTVQSIKPKPSSEKTLRKVDETKSQTPAPKPNPKSRPGQAGIEAKKKPPTPRTSSALAIQPTEVTFPRTQGKVQFVEKPQTPQVVPIEVPVKAAVIEAPTKAAVVTECADSTNESLISSRSEQSQSQSTSASMREDHVYQTEKPSTWLLLEKSQESYVCYECTAITKDYIAFNDRAYCSEDCVNASKQGRMMKCSFCSRDFLSICGVMKGSSWFCSQECTHRKVEVGSNTEVHTFKTSSTPARTIETSIGTEDEYIVTSLKPGKQKPCEARLLFEDPEPVISARRPSEARMKKFMASTEKVEGW